MMEKERYIKQAFKHYNENKKRRRELSFDSVRCADYSKPRIGKVPPQSNENALVRYLDEKRTIEKQVEIVERTLEYYKIKELAYGCGKYNYIYCRFVKGMSFTRAGIECNVNERTAAYWLNEIRETAAAIASIYSLWGIEDS